MLSLEDKKSNKDAFINSAKFGRDTYLSLYLFKTNSLAVLNIVGLYGNVVEKIDDKRIFPSTFNELEIIHQKQFVVVDSISKLLMIIEGLVILVHSLSEGYASVPNNMLNYDSRTVWKACENIDAQNYDMRKVLALLPPEQLGLVKEEEEFLDSLYTDTINAIYASLQFLVSFYRDYNIIYNKFKHGLTIFPLSFRPDVERKDFENSSLSARDHKNKEVTMPKGYFTAKFSDSTYDTWFNVESRLNFNKSLFSQIGLAINYTEIICKFMIDNNLIFAHNCGESYLPYKSDGIMRTIYFPTREPKKMETYSALVKSITDKIIPLLNIPEVNLAIRHSYKEEKLIKSVNENPVTNIWLIKP